MFAFVFYCRRAINALLLSCKLSQRVAEEERVPSEATSSCHVARGTRPASSPRRAHSSKTPLWFLYYRNKVSEWFRSTKRSHISGCPRQPSWMLTVCHVIRVTHSATSLTARSLPVYIMLFRPEPSLWHWLCVVF